ncbi:MAG: hypothetical protein R6U35_06530 [Candidatus Humimicrobiaceae bacterium]
MIKKILIALAIGAVVLLSATSFLYAYQKEKVAEISKDCSIRAEYNKDSLIQYCHSHSHQQQNRYNRDCINRCYENEFNFQHQNKLRQEAKSFSQNRKRSAK